MATRTTDPSTVRIDGPWAHRDVHANGIRLHIAETGEGPLVLLLHGFGQFWWTWRHQLTALSDAGYRAVAVDLRGYGDSDKPPRGYDAWTLAGDAGGLVKALGERKAHLVGHGWGGLLAWTVAAMHPRLVHSVAAIAAPHPLALRRQIRRTSLRRKPNNQAKAIGPLFRGQLPLYPERWLTRDDAVTVEHLMRRQAGSKWADSTDFYQAVERYREAMLVRGVAHSALEYYRWAVRSQVRSEGRKFTEALDRPIPVPALRLHGADDPLMLLATAKASGRWLDEKAPLHVLDDVGHFPHEEAPDVTSQILLDWLLGGASPGADALGQPRR
jgi:pimeloyl-ACP methyl ester carboxylesterase